MNVVLDLLNSIINTLSWLLAQMMVSLNTTKNYFFKNILFCNIKATINVMHAKVFSDMLENALIVPVKVLKAH
jgi:hypothetical protein